MTLGPSGGHGAASETLGDLIALTQRHLLGTLRGVNNVLVGALTAGDQTLTFQEELATTGIGRGSYLTLDDELVYVRSINTQQKQATVTRAQLGTTAAIHNAGIEVEVEARFSRSFIRQALRDEIRSWPRDVFRIWTLDLTTATDTRGYDLTGTDAEMFYVLDVERAPASVSSGLVSTTKGWVRPGYRVSRRANTTDFPSGNALIFDAPQSLALNLRVSIALPFVTTEWIDDVNLGTDVGLGGTMIDIPPLGAAWRLIAPRELRRSYQESQGQSRDAQEVPPRTASLAAQFLKDLRDRRLAEEAERLRSEFPYRMG